MQLLAASSSLDPAWALLLLALVLFAWWCQRGADRTEIRKEAARWRARVLRIEWLPGHTFNKNETAYEVTLKLASGKRLRAVCRCSRYADIVWEGPPWWSHGQPQQPALGQGQELSFRDTLAAHASGPEAAPVIPFDPAAESHRIVADCARCGYGLMKSSTACPNCGTEVLGD